MTDVASTWVTTNGHPSSGTRYQEMETENGTMARIVVEGREIVSPSYDVDSVAAQYQSRVLRAIGDDA